MDTINLSEESIARLGEVIAEKMMYAKNTPEPLLTIKQLSDKIGMSSSSIYHMVQRTDIPCARLGRSLRFKLTDVDRWIRTR